MCGKLIKKINLQVSNGRGGQIADVGEDTLKLPLFLVLLHRLILKQN